LLSVNFARAQKTIVAGKVKDAATGDPIPFANVVFKGTTIGTTTSFDGLYSLETNTAADTLIASYIGYITQKIVIKPGQAQTINIQLTEDVVELSEVVFYAGENPAFEILRNVVANKAINDKRQLDAYQYESYTKIEVDIDNMSDNFRNKKIVKKIVSVLDSIQVIAGENGQPILPIFFSEAISNYYVKNNPFMRHEYMIKTNVTGLGLTDGTFTSQIVGSTFQEYNFYRNHLTILEKEFASPIGMGWKGIYHYDLVDSVYIGEDFTYRIDFFPKRKHDLAFSGTMWITKAEYAVKQIDASVSKSANLNFVEKLRVQQELVKTAANAWIPAKTRVLVDIAEPAEDMAGVLAKFYTSNTKIVINQPKEDAFYRLPLEMDEGVRMSDELYWEANRHEKLSRAEVNVYNMVDTLKRIPVVKTYSDLAKLAYSGFYKIGKFDIGPYPLFLSFNDVEGLRLGLGGETNFAFSQRWILKGYAGYGVKDERWKYSVGVDYVISRKPWTKISTSVGREVDPVYLLFEEISGQVGFYAFTKLGTLRQPFLHDRYKIKFVNQLVRDVNLKLTLGHDYMQPLFEFAYYDQPETDPTSTQETIRTTEVKIELEWAKDRKYLINDNDRYHAGLGRYPVITLRYTAGLKDIFESDFEYHKIGLTAVKKFKLGQFGNSVISLDGEYIIGTLPYPLLINHLGNETPFYTEWAYSLMDNFEFVSDHYASATYRHHFNGSIMNRIPLFKYLKLRLLGEARILMGGISQENIDIIVPQYNTSGTLLAELKSLSNDPYVEVGYGVENIFKVIQINFIHRLTHTHGANVRNFGVKIGFRFTL
jgi:hypothetical protein